MKISITKDSLICDLRRLGVKEGDVVFLTADLLKAGFFSGDRQKILQDWLEVLLQSVGKSGTLVIPAFTNYFSRFKKDRDVSFTRDSIPLTGALSVAFHGHPEVLRSKHPTNSFFAIGKYAKQILEGHDENSTSYLPYKKIIALNGKHLIIGAIQDRRLAPMPMHYAQEILGLTRKKWSAGFLQSYYVNDVGNKQLFTWHDPGGCSAAGYKTLGHHVIKNAISFGRVGRGSSAYIDCQKSLEIFLEILNNDPGILRCDNKKCADCFGSPVYKHPIFWLNKIMRYIFNRAINFTEGKCAHF